MKATVAMNPNYYTRRPVRTCPYPNARGKRITAEKVVDTLLAIAITASVVTILLFLLTLG